MTRPCACQSLFQISPPIDKDELAKANQKCISINDHAISTYTPAMSYIPTLAMSCIPTPAMLCIPTPASALFLTPAKLVAKYTNANLQKATQLTLKSFVQG